MGWAIIWSAIPHPPPLPPGYCCGLNQAKPSEQHFEYLSRNGKLLLFAFTIYHVYKIIQKKKTHINLKNLAKSFGLGPLHKEKSITAAYRPSLTHLLPAAVEICPPRSHCSKVKIRDCRFLNKDKPLHCTRSTRLNSCKICPGRSCFGSIVTLSELHLYLD